MDSQGSILKLPLTQGLSWRIPAQRLNRRKDEIIDMPRRKNRNPWKRTLTVLVYGVIALLVGFGVLDSDLFPQTDDDRDIRENATGMISEDGEITVHFIDVGQADSILVITPGNRVMLVDAGNNSDGELVTEYLANQGINRIDVVVGTHPHEDHIGGLDTVIENFDIGKIYMPKAVTATKTFEDVLKSVKNKGLKVNTAEAGVDIGLDPQLTSVFLAPNSGGYEDLNNYSAVIKLTYGSTSFLLSGDAEDLSEEEMLQKGYDLKADVLKVGHHGSSSSTTEEFLSEVDPEFAVIMAGKGNEYGHPHKEVMERLEKRGIKVFRTDQNGTIIAKSDGNKIEFNTEPGDYSYPGK